MRVKMTAGVADEVTDRDFLVRLVRVVGGLVGFTAGLFVLALLTAGHANAEQSGGSQKDHGASPQGLLGAVTDGVTGVVHDVVSEPVAPVVHGVATLAAPVVQPVADVVAPVIQPVLTPATEAVAPVLFELKPVTEPLVGPVVRAADPVLKPVAATDPVVRAVADPVPASDPPGTGSPGTGRVDHSDLPVPSAVTVSPSWSTVPEDAHVVRATDSAEVGRLPRADRVITEHAVTAESAGSTVWSGKPVPGAPVLPPSGPAATGAPGGTALAPHGPGVDGSSVHGDVVRASLSGSWRVSPGALMGPSWWTSYGRHHPS